VDKFSGALPCSAYVDAVEAHTDIENIAEQRALEAAGFEREGIIRGGQWRHGAYHDGYLYSALRDDIAQVLRRVP
jgi:RimJ/RimL family protein N-acetyltransferase